MQIRAAVREDEDRVWRVLEPMIRAGETYALPREMRREDALAYWFAAEHQVFVAEEDDTVAGTYYLRANQRGGGSHVANCGYVVAQAAAGRGIGRAMGLHSLQMAEERGFRAVQFNCVVSSNEHAVALWRSLGFAVVGRLPAAFCHPRLGYVDALVMYRLLKDGSE